jgi:hypothetical protein
VLVVSAGSERGRDHALGVSEKHGFIRSTLRLEGPIAAGDTQRFIAALSGTEEIGAWDKLEIELHSPGGDYSEGLRLAAEFRRRGVETVVLGKDGCYSACVLAFLGGAERLRDVSVDPEEIPNQPPARSIERGAHLGFHASYLNVPSSEYTSENVQDAYRIAVDSIALLIQLAQISRKRVGITALTPFAAEWVVHYTINLGGGSRKKLKERGPH